jgi:hypothetical protein
MKDLCKWYDKEVCEDCERTEQEWSNCECKQGEMLTEMASSCINCSGGIMNPTFDGKMACDKCGCSKPVEEVAQLESHKRLRDYIVTIEDKIKEFENALKEIDLELSDENKELIRERFREGHSDCICDIGVTRYGDNINIALECESCYAVILDSDCL